MENMTSAGVEAESGGDKEKGSKTQQHLENDKLEGKDQLNTI